MTLMVRPRVSHEKLPSFQREKTTGLWMFMALALMFGFRGRRQGRQPLNMEYGLLPFGVLQATYFFTKVNPEPKHVA